MKYLISYFAHEIVSGFNNMSKEGNEGEGGQWLNESMKWFDELFYDGSEDTHHKDKEIPKKEISSADAEMLPKENTDNVNTDTK